ncbi:MAG: adenosylcobinamide-phosphate synthase [Pseudonocardiales bacterium]|nr:adenosylcobinamide-phosphate synthase [Pseudonocardiales bacterium]
MPGVAVATGLAIGVVADEVLGDPRRAHPVAGYGRAVTVLEGRCYADSRTRGGLFTLLALVPLVLGARLLEVSVRSRPLVRAFLVAVATWTALGGRSLRRVGAALADDLTAGDPDAARALLPSLCGRDPQDLDDTGLTRACIESLAENTSDAVVAPLLWGAVGGLPGILGYRAVNTLDAMVGHRSARYARFGTAAARLDDAANLVPARVAAGLTLAVAPLVSGSVRSGWAAWREDAAAHPSPNAGVCEAAAAGVLGVRLGGTTVYGGRVEQRPDLGPDREPEAADIRRMIRLSRIVEIGALALAGAVALRGRR